MDETSSSQHAQILAELRRKTEEAENILAEARYIEQENIQLRETVAAAKRGLVEAEHQLIIKDTECANLQATVQAQQNTIDQLLSTEVARASGKPIPAGHLALPPPRQVPSHRAAASIVGEQQQQQQHSPSADSDQYQNNNNNQKGKSSIPPTPTLPPAAIAQLEKDYDDACQKIESLEQQLRNATKAADEFKKGAAVHGEEMNRLQARIKQIENDANGRVEAAENRQKQAEDKAKSLQDAIVLMRDQHKQLLAEASHLEGVDAQAREGVRVEWMALASENERLMRVADEAASVQARVRQEHERIVGQLVSQRNHFDASAGVLRRELEAVHEENDRLLVNFQRVAAERDALRRDLEKAETLNKQQLDVDSSVVAARDLRRQIAEATASSQADASRAQSLERDLIRARDDITSLRGELDRCRSEVADRDAKLQTARRELETSKRNSGEMDHLQNQLELAQRQLSEMMTANEVRGSDPQQLGAFIDEVDTTTSDLISMAHQAASFLAPVPVNAPSISKSAQSGSPRRDSIKQRLAELRGLLRWIHSTLGEITSSGNNNNNNNNNNSGYPSVSRNNNNNSSSNNDQQQQQPRMPSVGSAANQNSRFSLMRSTSGGGIGTLRDMGSAGTTNNISLRDLSAQRDF